MLNQIPEHKIRSETERSLEPLTRYARPATMWRQNMFHIVKWYSVTEIRLWDDEQIDEYCVTWECMGGTGSNNGITWVDELPVDCELCQRCVEAIDFAQRREEQQTSVDRRAYAQRTASILRDIEKRK